MKNNQTKPIRTSMFSVRCLLAIYRSWMLNVAVLVTAGSALADVHYVDVNGTNATPPYTNWTTAATNIQDAVDAAVAGDEIVVTNGAYRPVNVNKPLNVRSVNGSQTTTIIGPGFGLACVYLANGANLSGFTLAYGNPSFSGGGVDGESWAGCTVNNCKLIHNDGGSYGGGAAGCTLNNCTLIGNRAGTGGGAWECVLNNCTLTGNRAGFDGAANACMLNNCITFGNIRWDFNSSDCEDCYSPGYLVDGINWTGDPLFVDTNGWSNLRLQSNSPCINAGINSYITNATDLDGNPRIAGGTVDIGAYEFQAPASMISYAWLQQFNLPISSSTDTADPDGDGVNNCHEWLAGSDPTNPFSFPPLLTLIPYGPSVILTWPTNAFGFTLQSTTNLASPAVWSTNSPAPVVIGGQNVIINPIPGPQQFYRLKQ